MVMVCLPQEKQISISRLKILFKLKIIAVRNILTESVHWKTLGFVEKLLVTWTGLIQVNFDGIVNGMWLPREHEHFDNIGPSPCYLS